MSRHALSAGRRGQSHVVGVALLLGITVVALGTLTAGIGAMVGSNAATAETTRVADDLADGLGPIDREERVDARITFAEGSIGAESRTVRIGDPNGTVRTIETDAVVYDRGDRRVSYHGGAVVRETRSGVVLEREPPIAAGPDPGDPVFLGIPVVDAGSTTVSGTGGVDVAIDGTVDHDRERLANDTTELAIETPTPTAWELALEDTPATVVTTQRRYDGDEHPSVVISFPTERDWYLLTYEAEVELRG